MAKNASPAAMGELITSRGREWRWAARRGRGAHRLRHRLDGPQRPIAHASFPSSAAATALVSLNGSTCLPMMTNTAGLAGDQQHVAAATPDRHADRLAAVADLDHAPGRRRRMAARIAAGFSLRGLSSVTTTRSACAAAVAPIIGALAGIAVAAAAEHDREPPRRVGPRQHRAWRARRACGRSRRRSARRVVLAHQLEAALGALEPSERRERVGRRAAGGDGEAGRDQRILDLEGAGQQQAHAIVAAAESDRQRLRESVDGRVEQADAIAAAPDRDDPQPAPSRRRRDRVEHARGRQRSRPRRAARSGR